MANVVVCNFAPSVSGAGAFDNFSGVWKLTRAMKRAGWVYKASSDGATKETTGNPANDKWGGGVTSFAGGSGAVISTKTTDVLTITGLSGLSASVVGHYLTISGSGTGANNGTFQILSYISATSVTIRNTGASATDAGPLTWSVKDPLLDTIPTITANAWWCAQGPSTLKIPFIVAPTGTFLRGEKVTQSATGAEGELVGITFDPVGGSGWAVILPRVTGTGGSARGWSNTDTITGASSGATVTANGTIAEYVREVVFINTSTGATRQQGAIYFQVLDASTESTQRFSYLAVNAAGVTATVAPGAGGTGNTFPASQGSYVVLGTGGAMSGFGYWCNNTGGNSHTAALGNCQIIVANAMELTNQSADGSLFIAFQTVGVNASSHCHFTFQRCDDTDEGDVDPFVWYIPSSTTSAWATATTPAWNRTVMTDTDDYQDTTSSHGMVRTGRGSYRGVRKKGLTGEFFQVYAPCALFLQMAYGTSGPVFYLNSSADPEKIACAAVPTLVREPIYLASPIYGIKTRKGSLRWIYMFHTYTALDTYENRKWVAFGATFTSGNYDGIGIIVGPWDGTSVPSGLS